jgi:hypothetical protein
MPACRSKKKRMKRRTVFLVVAALVVLAVLYGLKEYFRTNKDLSGERAVAELAAFELVQAFENDSARSHRRYVEKVILVYGKIKAIQAEDNPVVLTLGEEGRMSSVQCSMDSTYASVYKSFSVGKQVRLKGMCTGAISQDLFGTDVKLNRCVIAQPSP